MSSTVDREIKLRNLKSKIIWVCCANLLSPPLKRVEPLRLGKDDSEAQKAYKRAEHERLLNERDMERIRREPELLKELEKIMERVKQARSEYTAPEVNYAATATANVIFHYYCERCKNQREEEFVLNHSTGDTVCKLCGLVISEHFINHGAAKRSFEGEEDQNHFGPKPDQLMPDSWNMRTSIMTMKNGREDPIFKKLSRAHNEVEMNLSTIGCDERRTRLGYKNKQKSEAFELMAHVADNLGIHASVVQRAKEEFSKYRDVRESLQQYEGVVAACLVLAYQELSLVEDLDIRAATVIAALRSAEGEPSNFGPAVDPNDPVVATLTEIPVGKWDRDQAQQWLIAVGSTLYSTQVDAIVGWLDEQLQAQVASQTPSNSSNSSEMKTETSAQQAAAATSGTGNGAATSTSSAAGSVGSSVGRTVNKRKYPEITAKFMGTTTISGRNKKTYGATLTNHPTPAGAGGTGGGVGGADNGKPNGGTTNGTAIVIGAVKPQVVVQTAGNILFGAKFLTIFNEKCPEASNNELAADVFTQATRRRVQFEAMKKEAYDMTKKEVQRRRIEELSDKRSVVLAASSDPTLDADLDTIKGQIKKQDSSQGGASNLTVSAEAKDDSLGLVDELEQLAGPPVDLSKLFQKPAGAVSTGKKAVALAAGAGSTAGLRPVKSETVTASVAAALRGASAAATSGAAAGNVPTNGNVPKQPIKKPKIVLNEDD